MTEIKFWGDTYVGTAEDDHGVFTNPYGTVYAGQIADGSARVGVGTYTGGTTSFVECDADGKLHGRVLGCTADGYTVYRRYEHGYAKEYAVLNADGTCEYNCEACRADYAPFAALRAMVVPIKARPALVPPQPPFFVPHAFRPHRPPVGPIGHCFCHSQELATTHAEKVRTCRLRHQCLHGPRVTLHSSCQTNAPRVQPGRRAGRKGALRMRHKPHA
jgi:hypothetical protein